MANKNFPNYRTEKAASICLSLFLIITFGCSINFDVTSQRTALENQIIGSYNEMDDDLVLVASVRSLDQEGKKKDTNISDMQGQALKARQNQEFNQDDIDELKNDQILGEANDGTLTFLPKDIGTKEKVSQDRLKLAKVLVEEENHDRQIVWKRIIQSNENLGDKDLLDVRRTYAKMQRDSAKAGQWLQEEDGIWKQKVPEKKE